MENHAQTRGSKISQHPYAIAGGMDGTNGIQATRILAGDEVPRNRHRRRSQALRLPNRDHFLHGNNERSPDRSSRKCFQTSSCVNSIPLENDKGRVVYAKEGVGPDGFIDLERGRF